MEENQENTPTGKRGLQILLPLFPVEASLINGLIAVQKKEKQFITSMDRCPFSCIMKVILIALDISAASSLPTAFANK
ncbi:MAG: hypothetical protein ABI280_15210, partial [Ginsengibacter sp.]